jgi:uncharacterized coiled-coil protein SlyX
MARAYRAAWRLSSGVAMFALASAMAGVASAQSAGGEGSTAASEDTYKQRLAADEKALAEQAQQIADQRAMIDEQKRELDALKASIDSLENIRATGRPSDSLDAPLPTAPGAEAVTESAGGGGSGAGGAPSQVNAAHSASATPEGQQPVGEAPPKQTVAVALPTGINALTPAGHLVYEAGVDYQNSGSNRLVFEGEEIVSAVLIGVIEANRTENNSVIAWNNFRYGIIPRLEAEVDVPYVYRNNLVATTVPIAGTNFSQTRELTGWGVGDVDGIIRYQITEGTPGQPIVIANLEAKSDSGTGPYNVRFNSQGVAGSLPVGTGFWALEPSFTVIYPSDPLVFFGNLGYIHSFGYNINKNIGSAHVGLVSPGDGVNATLGFSFAVNQRFSYSLGFQNNLFLSTYSHLTNLLAPFNSVKASSGILEAGQFLLGGSYRFTQHLTLNLNFQFGVTDEAPNTTILIRLPYVF